MELAFLRPEEVPASLAALRAVASAVRSLTERIQGLDPRRSGTTGWAPRLRPPDPNEREPRRALAALVVVVLVRVDLAADLTAGPSLSVDVGIRRAGPNGLQRLGEVAGRPSAYPPRRHQPARESGPRRRNERCRRILPSIRPKSSEGNRKCLMELGDQAGLNR